MALGDHAEVGPDIEMVEATPEEGNDDIKMNAADKRQFDKEMNVRLGGEAFVEDRAPAAQ